MNSERMQNTFGSSNNSYSLTTLPHDVIELVNFYLDQTQIIRLGITSFTMYSKLVTSTTLRLTIPKTVEFDARILIKLVSTNNRAAPWIYGSDHVNRLYLKDQDKVLNSYTGENISNQINEFVESNRSTWYYDLYQNVNELYVDITTPNTINLIPFSALLDSHIPKQNSLKINFINGSPDTIATYFEKLEAKNADIRPIWSIKMYKQNEKGILMNASTETMSELYYKLPYVYQCLSIPQVCLKSIDHICRLFHSRVKHLECVEITYNKAQFYGILCDLLRHAAMTNKYFNIFDTDQNHHLTVKQKSQLTLTTQIDNLLYQCLTSQNSFIPSNNDLLALQRKFKSGPNINKDLLSLYIVEAAKWTTDMFENSFLSQTNQKIQSIYDYQGVRSLTWSSKNYDGIKKLVNIFKYQVDFGLLRLRNLETIKMTIRSAVCNNEGDSSTQNPQSFTYWKWQWNNLVRSFHEYFRKLGEIFIDIEIELVDIQNLRKKKDFEDTLANWLEIIPGVTRAMVICCEIYRKDINVGVSLTVGNLNQIEIVHKKMFETELELGDLTPIYWKNDLNENVSKEFRAFRDYILPKFGVGVVNKGYRFECHCRCNCL